MWPRLCARNHKTWRDFSAQPQQFYGFGVCVCVCFAKTNNYYYYYAIGREGNMKTKILIEEPKRVRAHTKLNTLYYINGLNNNEKKNRVDITQVVRAHYG